MSPVIRITVKGGEEAVAAIQTAVREGVTGGLEAAGLRGEQLVKESILAPPFGPPVVATGTLVNSITHQLEANDVLAAREVVFAQAPADQYAAYVEAGTGPHFPPPRALLLWVKKKFGIRTEKEALSAAFAVARAIARRGTLARGVFHAAFGNLTAELGGIFSRAIGAALEKAGAAGR